MEEEEIRFFNVYTSLPIEERKRVIMIIDGEPISWNLAYEEIKNKTQRGKKILKRLSDLELI